MATAALKLGDEPIIIDNEDNFQTVTKHRIKRKREGSLAVESLTLRSESSSSDTDRNIFSTPTQNSRQTELKVYITPIEKKPNPSKMYTPKRLQKPSVTSVPTP